MVSRAIILAHRLVLESGDRLSAASVALIRRSLHSLAKIGIREVAVVDGQQADELRERLALHELPFMAVHVIANHSWRNGSGAAVLLARYLLERPGDTSPCLVVRGDRPLDDESLARLACAELPSSHGSCDAVVVVASPPEGDLSAEVKVRLRKPRRLGIEGQIGVTELGFDLDPYQAIFTGHALVGPALLAELERLPNPTLEDGLTALVARGRVQALNGRPAWLWGTPQPVEVEQSVAAILEGKSHPHYTLFNPGPVLTSPRVKSALVHHDVCHRDALFSELMVSLTGRLRRIFRGTPEHTVVLITGSGTAAMECTLSSSVPRDRKVLIIDNGAFGERLLEIAKLHDMDAVHLRYAWGDTVDPADVERALAADRDIAVVAMIHHETSVGLLNPVREIGALCQRYDALLLVDAVSSLGAEDVDVVRDNIDICYGSANKCLHAVSGASFVCVSPRAWRKIELVKPRSYYLDLRRYRRYIDELAQTPFTPAVSAYFALDAACAEFLTDGHAHRFAMYRRRNRRLREGLAALGMAPFTRTGKESSSIVTCCVPDGVTFEELYEALKARGIIIYGCKDVLAERFLQVANMGDLSDEVIEAFLVATREEIARIRTRGSQGRRVVARRAVAASRA